MNKLRQQYFDSVAVPAGALLLIAIAIIGIGSTFIGAYQGGEKDRIDRPELWIGVGILLGVIAIMGFLSRQPDGTGFLGKEVAIGSVGMWDDALPPVDLSARFGEQGTTADITGGYRLYAASGQLAVADGVLPGGVDYGRRYSGMIYAHGVKSASRELWIPFEAVTAVYPETKAAFLAINGDETEFLGWTSPPEGMTRGAKKESANDKVK